MIIKYFISLFITYINLMNNSLVATEEDANQLVIEKSIPSLIKINIINHNCDPQDCEFHSKSSKISLPNRGKRGKLLINFSELEIFKIVKFSRYYIEECNVLSLTNFPPFTQSIWIQLLMKEGILEYRKYFSDNESPVNTLKFLTASFITKNGIIYGNLNDDLKQYLGNF